MKSHRLRLMPVTLIVAGLLGACGSGDNSTEDGVSNDISGTVTEWAVRTDATKAKAGEVTFTIKNDGTVGHEFLVVKTDIAPGEIPLDGDHFSEDGIEVIDEIGEFAIGTTETLTLNLEPGKYQLVCNLPDHYGDGMYTGFEVIS